eukprot:g9978.t1
MGTLSLVVPSCLKPCFAFLEAPQPVQEEPDASPTASLAPPTPVMPKVQSCQGCEAMVDEFAQNAQGQLLCRTMYLGDLKEATDFELLQQRNITAVLNLINWWELSSRLPEVADFSKCKAQGKRVLVNCKAGHNRSACMCVSWLVACEGYGLLEAVDMVQTKRGTILKLKNEAVIYLSLEHPHIARLFDVYEDNEQVSLVMQYCSGGTLESAIRSQGAFVESTFQDLAVPMLLAVNYIHCCGIVHRDIKPRNWVYEADGKTIKLIDFGFSVKGYLSTEGLRGCMGTLGYLAPEVVTAGLSNENAYTDKCDIWSLGVVFVELLTGEPAFHRDAGQCDGYTEEVVLREIKEVTEESLQRILEQVPKSSKSFLEEMLTKSPLKRPSSKDWVKIAWLLAVARSPTYLPWEDFCALRDTFKMFDAVGLNGTVNLETFLLVIGQTESNLDMDESPRRRISKLWKAVCGEQESLSYCEFLAVLLPPMEDVFEDASQVSDEVNSPLQPREHWNPSRSVSNYFSQMKRSPSSFFPQALLYDEEKKVSEVVGEMARFHRRWALIRFKDGTFEFFDYMDINHRLLEDAGSNGSAAEALSRICDAPVGSLANCSRFCAFKALDVQTPLRDVLHLIAGRNRKKRQGQVGVFSCLDFLNLALKSTAPTAVLKSLSAKVFDRRSTILQVSVNQDEPLLHALSIMKAEGLTICPVTSRELSGSLGGVVASNVDAACFRLRTCVTNVFLFAFELLLVLQLEGTLNDSWFMVMCPWIALEIWWLLHRLYYSRVAWTLADPEAAVATENEAWKLLTSSSFWCFFVSFLQRGALRLLTCILIAVRADSTGGSWFAVFVPLYISSVLAVVFACIVKKKQPFLHADDEEEQGTAAPTCCLSCIWLAMLFLAAGKPVKLWATEVDHSLAICCSHGPPFAHKGGTYSAAWIFSPIFFFMSLAVCLLSVGISVAQPQHFAHAADIMVRNRAELLQWLALAAATRRLRFDELDFQKPLKEQVELLASSKLYVASMGATLLAGIMLPADAAVLALPACHKAVSDGLIECGGEYSAERAVEKSCFLADPTERY